MIHLFPKLKKKMLLIAVCYIALVAVYIVLNPGANHLVTLLISGAGLAIIMFGQLLNAYNAHSALLSKLYSDLNVDGFLKLYEPMLNIPLKNDNVALTVRLHASNAYCAQGRFDDAIALLKSCKLPNTGKPENDLLSKFAIVSNLCYCAEQKEDIETARAYMDELLDLKKKLEAMQTSKPEKKRMVFNTELNEQCMLFLTTGKCDIDALQILVKNNSQLLHKVTISLWIARAYLAENNRREAEKLLERIVNVAPTLYPGRMAASILSGLPGKTEEA
ncbi:MAG: hypothetical protein IJN79_03575 [Clostridia bacterium]|nr:hypothetical protein [Clostridia bacterium]